MYVVRWKRTALNRLTELWLESSDRDAMTEAVSEIDRKLASNPNEAGESRSESIRILYRSAAGCLL
jgi:hypothetical protein